MQEHFPLYDSDGDGLLTVPQFQQVMQLLRSCRLLHDVLHT